MVKDMPSYGLGTLVAFAIVAGLVFLFISDITQKKLTREHVRIVQASGQSVAMNMLYPYPEPKARIKAA